jgi:P-type Ca2+ transporter type 2C
MSTFPGDSKLSNSALSVHDERAPSSSLGIKLSHLNPSSLGGASELSATPTSFTPSPISAIETRTSISSDSTNYEEFLQERAHAPRKSGGANPFAFDSELLAKLHDPKSLKLLRTIGGILGLAAGLRTDIEKGLAPDEDIFHRKVTIQDVRQKLEDLRQSRGLPRVVGESLEMETPAGVGPEHSHEFVRHSTSVFSNSLTWRRPLAEHFQDRRRIFSVNRIPSRPPKNFFGLLWGALQDPILVWAHFPSND